MPTLPLALTLLAGFAALLAFPSVSSVVRGNLLFPGLLTSTLHRSVSCKDQLIPSWVVEVMEAPCVQYSRSCSPLLLSVVISCPLESALGAGSCHHCPGGDCSQEQDMLIVELSLHLSQNGVLGGHRRLQKLLLLGVCLEQRQLHVLFREKMELKEPLHGCTGHTPEPAST